MTSLFCSGPKVEVISWARWGCRLRESATITCTPPRTPNSFSTTYCRPSGTRTTNMRTTSSDRDHQTGPSASLDAAPLQSDGPSHAAEMTPEHASKDPIIDRIRIKIADALIYAYGFTNARVHRWRVDTLNATGGVRDTLRDVFHRPFPREYWDPAITGTYVPQAWRR